MAKTNAASELAGQLLNELTACRELGGDHYPLKLDQLASRLDSVPDPTAILNAVKNANFTSRAVLAIKAAVDSPVALIEDLPALAASPLTLESVLRVKKPTKSGPLWSVSVLKLAVQKPLQSAFFEAVTRQVESGTLPSFAGSERKGKSFVVFHKDHPPPPKPQKPPPPPKLEVVDADCLLAQLRRLTPAEAPPPLLTLDALAHGVNISAVALQKAIKVKSFKDSVELADSPLGKLVVLKDRINHLASSASIIECLVAACEQRDVNAFPIGDVVSTLGKSALKTAVESFLRQHDLAETIPEGIGFVTVKGAGKKGPTRIFFRMENLPHRQSPPKPPMAPETPAMLPAISMAEFAAAFESAFDRLDRERGSYNFVSLVDLRAALSTVPRESFDAGLQTLRKQRRYWLKSAEGFDGLRPEERDAAIPEEGELLLHVSKARS